MADRASDGMIASMKHSQYCLVRISSSVSSQNSRYLCATKNRQPILIKYFSLFLMKVLAKMLLQNIIISYCLVYGCKGSGKCALNSEWMRFLELNMVCFHNPNPVDLLYQSRFGIRNADVFHYPLFLQKIM